MKRPENNVMMAAGGRPDREIKLENSRGREGDRGAGLSIRAGRRYARLGCQDGRGQRWMKYDWLSGARPHSGTARQDSFHPPAKPRNSDRNYSQIRGFNSAWQSCVVAPQGETSTGLSSAWYNDFT